MKKKENQKRRIKDKRAREKKTERMWERERKRKKREGRKERKREREGGKEKDRIKKEGMKVRNRQRERVRICKKMFKQSGYIRKDLGSMDGLTKKPYYWVVVYLISKMMHLFIPLLQ